MAVELRSLCGYRHNGQLRRNTDRFIHHRLDSIALAIALVVTIKLIKWADRFNMAA